MGHPYNTNNAEGETAQTIAPAHATPAYVAGQDPEFVDAPGLQFRFGIKRSLAYVLLDAGLIRGASLRRKGQLRGKRLFNVASVRDYLNSQMAEGGK